MLEAARTIGKGAEECAMHVKGQEMGLREFRGRKGMALAQAVATKLGGGEYPLPEATWSIGTTSKRAVYPPSYDDKALMVWEQANIYKVVDMLGICKNIIPWTVTQSLEIPARLFSLATGVDTSEDELLTAAHKRRQEENKVLAARYRQEFKTAVAEAGAVGELPLSETTQLGLISGPPGSSNTTSHKSVSSRRYRNNMQY